jgi:hypothetical protein
LDIFPKGWGSEVQVGRRKKHLDLVIENYWV